MSIKHEEKTVVALSIGDVTSGVKSPLAAEIEIPPNRQSKTGCNFQTMHARQVVCIEH
jgi:hypothetical protein